MRRGGCVSLDSACSDHYFLQGAHRPLEGALVAGPDPEGRHCSVSSSQLRSVGVPRSAAARRACLGQQLEHALSQRILDGPARGWVRHPSLARHTITSPINNTTSKVEHVNGCLA